MEKFTRTAKRLPVMRKKKGISTVQRMLEEKSSLHGDGTAYRMRKDDLSMRSVSFGDVFELSKRLAARLGTLGLRRGDHVAMVGENGPEWAISYFAVVWAGAVAVPLDSRATERNLKRVLGLSDSRFLIASGGFRETLGREEGIEAAIPMEEIAEDPGRDEKRAPAESADPDRVAEIVFTSGTTGTPKGVTLSHGNIMSSVESMYGAFPIGPGDTAFSILPIHHVYERICGILLSFYCGQTVFFSRSLKPAEMLADMRAARPTVWLNTPLVLEKLLGRIEHTREKSFLARRLPAKLFGKMARKRLGLSRLRFIVSGGAALSEKVQAGLEKYGFPLIQGYGMSETSAVVAANPFSEPRNSSCGMILEGNEVEIRDADAGGIGEICVKGPNVMKEYYKDREATGEILSSDGWLRTGDLGYFDRDGYLYVTGRKKSVIVTKGGKNISPEEIEEKLTALEEVEEAVVFSPDDTRIQAVVFPSSRKPGERNAPGDDEIWEAIHLRIRRLNRTLEPHKRISRFAVATGELPKTTTQKVKRYLFRDTDIGKTEKFVAPPVEK